MYYVPQYQHQLATTTNIVQSYIDSKDHTNAEEITNDLGLDFQTLFCILSSVNSFGWNLYYNLMKYLTSPNHDELNLEALCNEEIQQFSSPYPIDCFSTNVGDSTDNAFNTALYPMVIPQITVDLYE